MKRAIVVLAALAVAGCRAEGDKPGMTFLPDMVDSGLVKTFEASPLLPPEGTIGIERAPFLYGSGPEEARRAGAELSNPFSATAENLERGKQVFDTICFVCHGARGEGDGPIIGRFPNPPSLLAARARALPDGQIFHIVTRGQGIMPPHAAQVLSEDRWKAILYVRSLQGATPATQEAAR